jgi:hypothetical protein
MEGENTGLHLVENLLKGESVFIDLRIELNPLLHLLLKFTKQLCFSFIRHLLHFFDGSVSCFNLLFKRLAVAFF